MDDVVKGIGGEYTGNYTGPYWSNGKVQPSVEWGNQDPQSELDFLSRQHDSAYARFPDDKHREAADRLYNEEAQKLAKKFPSLAGNLVLYGNYAKRAASKTASNFGTGMRFGGLAGGLGGLIYTAAGNIIDANKMINGTYLSKETNDVKEYFKTDPRKLEQTQFMGGLAKGGKLLPNNKVDPFIKGTLNKVEPARGTLVGGPTVKDIKKAELIASQAKKVENYLALKHNAENKIPVTDWRSRIPAYRKKKKKNKLHPLHI
jgi:hypothetical protein